MAVSCEARYEELRGQVAPGSPVAGGQGLATLLRQGLAAWLEAWAEMPAMVPPPSAPQRSATVPWAAEVSSEAVRVVSAIVLAHCEAGMESP